MNISRFFLSILSLLSITACGGGSASSDGNSPTGENSESCALLGLHTKVLNGTGCENLEISPVVRIVSDFTSGRPGYCSGTMITPTKVLTAGHCGLDANDPQDSRIRSTVITGISGDNQYVDVSSIAVHPDFQVIGEDYINDVAVVTLSHPVPLPSLPISGNNVVTVGTTANVYGYGVTTVGSPGYINFNNLVHQTLDLRSGTMVLSQVSDYLYRAENLAGQTSLCHGDSGSPLVLEQNGHPVVIGVASAVIANGQTVHCAPGTYSQWTKLEAPSVIQELKALAPDASFE